MAPREADGPSARGPDASANGHGRTVAVVGASAGGVEALIDLARGLPAELPLAIIVVLHVPSGSSSRLPEILSRAGPLPAHRAEQCEVARPGTIYVAPPDEHLVLSDGRLFLVDGPRENGFRPAIDPLFRSAARAFRSRAIGILLSGNLDDGVAGLLAIKSFGGATIVQEPTDALVSGMPDAALQAMRPDHVVPAPRIGRVLAQLAMGNGADPQDLVGDATLVADPVELPAHGVDLSCPDCGGALQEVRPGQFSRYRCRVGHAYSPLSLLEHAGTALETALWAAVRSLEETATIAGRLASRAKGSGATGAAKRFSERQEDAAQRADLIRQAIASLDTSSGAKTEDAIGAPAE